MQPTKNDGPTKTSREGEIMLTVDQYIGFKTREKLMRRISGSRSVLQGPAWFCGLCLQIFRYKMQLIGLHIRKDGKICLNHGLEPMSAQQEEKLHDLGL